MKTITVDFPSMTAREIYQKSKNKVGGGKLFYDINWYESEYFFIDEKTREGRREINLGIEHKGESWKECKELKGEMLNFAEVVYLIWTYPEFRDQLMSVYTWTSSRASDGRLVYVGAFASVGVRVLRYRPDCSSGSLGVAFSRSLNIFESPKMINPLKQKEYNLLKDTGHQDLADKVQELVREFNKLEKPEENPSLEKISDVLWDCDTRDDLRKVLEDYIN